MHRRFRNTSLAGDSPEQTAETLQHGANPNIEVNFCALLNDRTGAFKLFTARTTVLDVCLNRDVTATWQRPLDKRQEFLR
ncbi:MAG: hypothetical protein LAO77_19740 [Acidobacteriia bacterium]|nr:hypothetical protein [Terriglobia bacterium]